MQPIRANILLIMNLRTPRPCLRPRRLAQLRERQRQQAEKRQRLIAQRRLREQNEATRRMVVENKKAVDGYMRVQLRISLPLRDDALGKAIWPLGRSARVEFKFLKDLGEGRGLGEYIPPPPPEKTAEECEEGREGEGGGVSVGAPDAAVAVAAEGPVLRKRRGAAGGGATTPAVTAGERATKQDAAAKQASADGSASTVKGGGGSARGGSRPGMKTETSVSRDTTPSPSPPAIRATARPTSAGVSALSSPDSKRALGTAATGSVSEQVAQVSTASPTAGGVAARAAGGDGSASDGTQESAPPNRIAAAAAAAAAAADRIVPPSVLRMRHIDAYRLKAASRGFGAARSVSRRPGALDGQLAPFHPGNLNMRAIAQHMADVFATRGITSPAIWTCTNKHELMAIAKRYSIGLGYTGADSGDLGDYLYGDETGRESARQAKLERELPRGERYAEGGVPLPMISNSISGGREVPSDAAATAGEEEAEEGVQAIVRSLVHEVMANVAGDDEEWNAQQAEGKQIGTEPAAPSVSVVDGATSAGAADGERPRKLDLVTGGGNKNIARDEQECSEVTPAESARGSGVIGTRMHASSPRGSPPNPLASPTSVASLGSLDHTLDSPSRTPHAMPITSHRSCATSDGFHTPGGGSNSARYRPRRPLPSLGPNSVPSLSAARVTVMNAGLKLQCTDISAEGRGTARRLASARQRRELETEVQHEQYRRLLAAARKVQGLYKARHAKRSAIKKKYDAIEAKRHRAATVMQVAWRNRLIRKYGESFHETVKAHFAHNRARDKAVNGALNLILGKVVRNARRPAKHWIIRKPKGMSPEGPPNLSSGRSTASGGPRAAAAAAAAAAATSKGGGAGASPVPGLAHPGGVAAKGGTASASKPAGTRTSMRSPRSPNAKGVSPRTGGTNGSGAGGGATKSAKGKSSAGKK